MSEQKLELPNGWAETTLDNIAIHLQAGGTPSTKKPEYYQKGTIPFVKIDDITDSKTKYLETTKVKITKQGLDDSSAWLVPENSLLYSMYASYGLPIINKIKVATSQAIIVYQQPKDLISLDFMYYFLKFIGPFSITKGTTQKNLNAGIVKNYKVLLPPLNEQKRIVEKIEELFLELDETKDIIMNVKIQLKQYVQSLLKSAFEGKLTEQWRGEHSGKIISIDEFINLIKKSNSDKNQKFDEIKQEFVSNLEKIPSEWCWIYLSNLGELHRGKSKHRPRNDPILFGGKYPFIQTGVVRNSNGKITSFKQTYNDVGLAQSRLFSKGTICITIAANIADTALLTFPSCFPDSIVGYNGVKNLVENMFVMYYIQYKKTNLESIAPSTAQKNINLDILQKILVPIMSNDEQKEIVVRIEKGFSLTYNTDRVINSTLQTIRTMKMSILKKAFEGKLVPQDPNDEPAQILLEKIKSTKEGQLTKQRSK